MREHFEPISLSCAATSTCRAPTRPHRWLRPSVIRAPHQRDTVEVNGLPVVAMYPKIQTLVSASREHHESTAVLGHLHDAEPHLIPHLC
jgi:hypothetical protein